jgi:hypothetical protein
MLTKSNPDGTLNASRPRERERRALPTVTCYFYILNYT